MTSLTFFNDGLESQLYPFTRTRSAADIRCGILTLRERWEAYLNIHASGTLTTNLLQPLYPQPVVSGNTGLYINSRLLATPELVAAMTTLQVGQLLRDTAGVLLAARLLNVPETIGAFRQQTTGLGETIFDGTAQLLNRSWDIFLLNGPYIRHDFDLLTHKRSSTLLPAGVVTKKTEQIFVEEGAQIGLGVLLNAGDGPIYIGKNAEIMDGAIVRGPMALGEGATIKMGAKIYGDTVIGPGCKVGGEVSNAVFFANSNKGHDGFVGNCVIGEWCNIGADTNASNLKNNYDLIKIHDDATDKRLSTGRTFCGLLMGDHSKCGINTMFNTGTVIGVSCNIYGGEFPPAYLPSFSWGGASGLKTYTLDKALDTASRMMARRGKTLSDAEKAILKAIFDDTAAQRATHHSKVSAAAE
ncbi:MAG: glucose-1-phosphate thymidylyltransferase [Sphingobacteriales bacterium]|nr:MAG: glucose-1-phosphate thymidylyltransferase [Sphingobacteriales bacterium]